MYGLGANLNGVLRQPIVENEELNPHLNIHAAPVLLYVAPILRLLLITIIIYGPGEIMFGGSVVYHPLKTKWKKQQK